MSVDLTHIDWPGKMEKNMLLFAISEGLNELCYVIAFSRERHKFRINTRIYAQWKNNVIALSRVRHKLE